MKSKGPDFGQTKPWEWTKEAETLKKLRSAVNKHSENTNYWCH